MQETEAAASVAIDPQEFWPLLGAIITHRHFDFDGTMRPWPSLLSGAQLERR